MASGALSVLGHHTNDPDVAALRRQLVELRPDLSESERDEVVAQRTDELTHRTPHLVTWQDLTWPAHFADYCRFLKEAGKLDLDRLAAPEDGKYFLAAKLYGGLDTNLDDLWSAVRPDSPKELRVGRLFE